MVQGAFQRIEVSRTTDLVVHWMAFKYASCGLQELRIVQLVSFRKHLATSLFVQRTHADDGTLSSNTKFDYSKQKQVARHIHLESKVACFLLNVMIALELVITNLFLSAADGAQKSYGAAGCWKLFSHDGSDADTAIAGVNARLK